MSFVYSLRTIVGGQRAKSVVAKAAYIVYRPLSGWVTTHYLVSQLLVTRPNRCVVYEYDTDEACAATLVASAGAAARRSLFLLVDGVYS